MEYRALKEKQRLKAEQEERERIAATKVCIHIEMVVMNSGPTPSYIHQITHILKQLKRDKILFHCGRVIQQE